VPTSHTGTTARFPIFFQDQTLQEFSEMMDPFRLRRCA
jgi:hypothetical protein